MGTQTLIVSLFAVTFVFQDIKVTTGSMKNTILAGDHLVINKFIFSGDPRLPIPFLPQRGIRRGDVVVFKFPRDPYRKFVKRVVGLPGETIEIRGMKVFIDGKELVERRRLVNGEHDRLHRDEPLLVLTDVAAESSASSYCVYYDRQKNDPGDARNGDTLSTLLNVEQAPFSVGSPYKIPEGCFFCLGDNRDNSEDSRSWGVVPGSYIIGSPVMVFFSNDATGTESGFLSDFFSRARWGRIGTGIR